MNTYHTYAAEDGSEIQARCLFKDEDILTQGNTLAPAKSGDFVTEPNERGVSDIISADTFCYTLKSTIEKED